MYRIGRRVRRRRLHHVCVPHLLEQRPRGHRHSPILGPAHRTASAGRGAYRGIPAVAPEQMQLEAVGQGFGARLDDVLRDADGAPALLVAGGFEQDAGLGPGGRLRIEDADLVVGQADVAERGVERLEGLAEGAVQGMNGPVALRRRRERPRRPPSASRSPPTNIRRCPAAARRSPRRRAARTARRSRPGCGAPAARTFLRPPRTGIPWLSSSLMRARTAALAPLESTPISAARRRTLTRPESSDTTTLRVIADRLRAGCARSSRRPSRSPPRERRPCGRTRRSRRRARGASGVWFAISRPARDSSVRRAKLLVGHAGVSHLQLEGRHDRDQVRVPAALALAVDGSLHLRAAGLHGGQRVGHRQLAVVVGVDPERRAGISAFTVEHDLGDPRRAGCRRSCRTAPASRRPRCGRGPHGLSSA